VRPSLRLYHASVTLFKRDDERLSKIREQVRPSLRLYHASVTLFKRDDERLSKIREKVRVFCLDVARSCQPLREKACATRK